VVGVGVGVSVGGRVSVGVRVRVRGTIATLRRTLLLLPALACAPADPSWPDLDRTARLAFMTDEVEPTMREVFQARDPARYADFGCPSCHGPDPEGSDYAMPAFLPPLPLEGTLEAAEARNPEMTAFMLDEVFPTFVALIDEEKYDEVAAPDGYRCVGCHLVAQ